MTKETKAVEDFLKAVYSLQQDKGSDHMSAEDLAAGKDRVSTNALKDNLSISAPSVTDMAQRLVERGYVDYEKYRGVTLTDEGRSIAIKMIRRHRLLELYLVEELGYQLHEVHDEAERLEHAVSDHFIEAIAQKLGDPQFDPHGDPIPASDGSIVQRDLLPLAHLPLATPARVCRFIMSDAAMLQHTLDRGFYLMATVKVKARDPFEGPITIVLDYQEVVIGYQLAAAILVETLEDGAS